MPLDQYTANLRRIVQRLRDLGVPAVVLVTPPPVSEPHRLLHVLATYGVQLETAERTNAAAGQYAQACRALGAELGLPVVDLWARVQAVEGWAERLLCDGLHLTPEGNAAVGAAVAEVVAATWPELRPEAMPWDVPEWAALAAAGDVGAALEAHRAARA